MMYSTERKSDLNQSASTTCQANPEEDTDSFARTLCTTMDTTTHEFS